MAIALIKTLTIISLSLMLWPVCYSAWLSFSPTDFMEPPVRDWSLQWYRQFFKDPRWVASVITSLKVASLSVAFTLFLALTLLLYQSKYDLSRFTKALIMLPFLVPPVVLAMGLLPWFHQIGLWGTNTSIGLAHSIMIFPVVFLVLQDGLNQQPGSVDKAARCLGASSRQVLRYITLPLLFPWLTVSALIAIVISLNEFIIAQFLSAPDIETLPTVIWPSLRYTLSPVIASASTLSLVSTVVLLAITARLFRYIR